MFSFWTWLLEKLTEIILSYCTFQIEKWRLYPYIGIFIFVIIFISVFIIA